MPVSLQELAALKSSFPAAAPTINKILVRSLSPTQRRIYGLLRDVQIMEARDFRVKHGMIHTTAAQALREMHDMGLLNRKFVGPRKFVYWRARP